MSIDTLRRRGAAKRGAGEGICALDELAEAIPSGCNVEHEVEMHALSEELDRFLDTLKPVDREMFVCRYWLCADIKSISRRFDTSESRVKSTLMRTRNRLKEHLSKEGYI